MLTLLRTEVANLLILYVLGEALGSCEAVNVAPQ